MRDLKIIVGGIVICILVLVAINLLIPTASAYGIIQNTTEVPNIQRVEQGSIVYLNETYDISGVTGWSTQLAWYGEYVDEPNPDITPFLVDIPGKTHTAKTSQYYYLIDNTTFKPRLGKWFQYYGTEEKERGNLVAFDVHYQRPVHFNQTNIPGIISYNITNEASAVKPTPAFILEEVKVSNYLIARGDKLNITVNKSTNAWLFGRLDSIYDYHSLNGSIDIQKEYFGGMEPGSYMLILQTSLTNNTDFTVRYNTEDKSIEWFDSKLFSVHKESIAGYSPYVALEKIKEIFPQSRDSYAIYKFELQDPKISIVSRDTTYVGGKQVLDIRGYTNVAKGTKINLVLDEDKQTARTINQSTFIGEAVGDERGNMRQYQIYMPINPETMPDGIHTIKATTEIGGECYADFPISQLPADSFVPNATVKYIGDRNPWVPTPTPEVITIVKEVPGPTVTILVPVTPREEVVRAQQEKVLDDKIGFWIPRIITTVVGLIVLLYLISVWLRSKKK
jgi:hypothetical protein